jgi:hypothetical protein
LAQMVMQAVYKFLLTLYAFHPNITRLQFASACF